MPNSLRNSHQPNRKRSTDNRLLQPYSKPATTSLDTPNPNKVLHIGNFR
jgi:hypothetical protein